MDALLIWYEKCSTCQKAAKWLREHGVPFTARPIKEQTPTVPELKEWMAAAGLPLRKWFNVSGLSYRALKQACDPFSFPEEEQLRLLAADGMLLKRPILVYGKTILLGFREQEWAKALTPDDREPAQ